VIFIHAKTIFVSSGPIRHLALLFILFPFSFLLFQEELNKHNNEAETSQSAQKTQSNMPWKNDIYSEVKGAEKRGHVRCIGNIPKPKKSKASLSENQELRDELQKKRESQEKMQESQDRTNLLMANIMSVIQNLLSEEDLNVILQAAKHV
jgi:hypothetical protein